MLVLSGTTALMLSDVPGIIVTPTDLRLGSQSRTTRVSSESTSAHTDDESVVCLRSGVDFESLGCRDLPRMPRKISPDPEAVVCHFC